MKKKAMPLDRWSAIVNNQPTIDIHDIRTAQDKESDVRYRISPGDQGTLRSKGFMHEERDKCIQYKPPSRALTETNKNINGFEIQSKKDSPSHVTQNDIVAMKRENDTPKHHDINTKMSDFSRPYQVSPVATVAYIRSQLREDSPSVRKPTLPHTWEYSEKSKYSREKNPSHVTKKMPLNLKEPATQMPEQSKTIDYSLKKDATCYVKAVATQGNTTARMNDLELTSLKLFDHKSCDRTPGAQQERRTSNHLQRPVQSKPYHRHEIMRTNNKTIPFMVTGETGWRKDDKVLNVNLSHTPQVSPPAIESDIRVTIVPLKSPEAEKGAVRSSPQWNTFPRSNNREHEHDSRNRSTCRSYKSTYQALPVNFEGKPLSDTNLIHGNPVNSHLGKIRNNGGNALSPMKPSRNGSSKHETWSLLPHGNSAEQSRETAKRRTWQATKPEPKSVEPSIIAQKMASDRLMSIQRQEKDCFQKNIPNRQHRDCHPRHEIGARKNSSNYFPSTSHQKPNTFRQGDVMGQGKVAEANSSPVDMQDAQTELSKRDSIQWPTKDKIMTSTPVGKTDIFSSYTRSNGHLTIDKGDLDLITTSMFNKTDKYDVLKITTQEKPLSQANARIAFPENATERLQFSDNGNAVVKDKCATGPALSNFQKRVRDVEEFKERLDLAPKSVPDNSKTRRPSTVRRSSLKPVNLFPGSDIEKTEVTGTEPKYRQREDMGRDGRHIDQKDKALILSNLDSKCQPGKTSLNKSEENVRRMSIRDGYTQAGSYLDNYNSLPHRRAKQMTEYPPLTKTNSHDTLRTRSDLNISSNVPSSLTGYRFYDPHTLPTNLQRFKPGHQSSSRERFSGVGVLHAKSVDIASIYSMPSRQLSEKLSYIQVKHSLEVPMDVKPATEMLRSETEKTKQNLYKPKISQSCLDKYSSGEILGQQNDEREEFRPASVFLDELKKSFTDSGSPVLNASPRPFLVFVPNSPIRKGPEKNFDTAEKSQNAMVSFPETNRKSFPLSTVRRLQRNVGSRQRMNQQEIRNALSKRLSYNPQTYGLSNEATDRSGNIGGFRSRKQSEIKSFSHFSNKPQGKTTSIQNMRPTPLTTLQTLPTENTASTNSSNEIETVYSTFLRPAGPVFKPEPPARRHTMTFSHDIQTRYQPNMLLNTASRHDSNETLSSGYRSLERKKNNTNKLVQPVETPRNIGEPQHTNRRWTLNRPHINKNSSISSVGEGGQFISGTDSCTDENSTGLQNVRMQNLHRKTDNVEEVWPKSENVRKDTLFECTIAIKDSKHPNVDDTSVKTTIQTEFGGSALQPSATRRHTIAATDCPRPRPTSKKLLPAPMDRKKGAGRNRNVFKGSVLVSLLVESHPKRFPNRAIACKLARRLFREGQIRSIFGAKEFEDSAQLYVWHENGVSRHGNIMTSPTSSSYSNPGISTKYESGSHRHTDWELIQDIKNKVLNRSEAYNIVTSYNTFFQELEQDFGLDHQTGTPRKNTSSGSDIGWGGNSSNTPYTSTLELKKDTLYSTDSSVDNQHYSGKLKHTAAANKSSKKHFKHSSLSPYSQSPSSKNTSPHTSQDISPHISHETTSHLKHQYINRPIVDNYSHHRSAPKMNSNTESPMDIVTHTNSNLVPEERVSSTNYHKSEPVSMPSQPDPTGMDYNMGSNQQGTASSHVSSAVTESGDNNSNTNTGAVDSAMKDRNTKWTQEQSYGHQQAATDEIPNWFDPSSGGSHSNPQWNSQNMNQHMTNNGMDVGSGHRWPESVVSEGLDSGRRWPESTNSYSDNEKQLLEEMRRMKKEHQNVLRTYEGRINKLMAKMHELRNIAEMLENSSNKSSPYGVLPGKLALLNILGDKNLEVKKTSPLAAATETEQVPPPLPPRPGRGSRVYPNKPIIHTTVAMRPLPWSRIILEDTGDQSNTVWLGMIEPKIDTTELERLFSGVTDAPNEVNLYEDICLRRGRPKSQLVLIYDTERSQRIISELRGLRCTLPDVIQAFVTLNCDELPTDSFAELLELLASPRELEKILHHAKRKGTGQLDAPEFLVSELSKVDHFRERLEFLRFKNKLQINLFEIDQQLRELHTACEEISSSISLKHVLETVLVVGNHMNAGTDRGQADGFKMDILNSLKDVQDLSKQGNLLELVMRIYCLKFESSLDFGCPTRFLLPEPSNMRHAAQVSFEDIQRALKELKDELSAVRNKLESLSKREASTLTIALRVTSENFMTSAVEVLAEEEKLLEETKVQFWKTAAYFSQDGQRSTPHEFFQVWASFLHDCKYYWKLAHRNLAKMKFNTDLVTKSQLSSSSLPGFNSLKSVMMKHVASFQQDEEMRASKAQQLQHINSWIESVGKYAMEMEPDLEGRSQDLEKNLEHNLLPHSPKQHHLRQQTTSELEVTPPYENQPAIPPFQHKESVKISGEDEQLDQKANKNFYSKDRNTHTNNFKPDERNSFPPPSSPKPIKAIPPDVIKPQPLLHTSPTMSSPSPTAPSLHLAQPMTVVPFQSSTEVDTNNNKHSNDFQDDNFGFEPLYESLSRHARNYTVSPTIEDAIEIPPNYLESVGNDPPLSPRSGEGDSAHKKNAKFFKSLLKRDQKRPASSEEITQGSQQPSRKGVSAPFNKLKNTFVRLSSSGNSKKSNNDSHKVHHSPGQNQAEDMPPKPQRGLSVEQDQLTVQQNFPTDGGQVPFHSSKVVETGKDNLNYQNYHYPGQPRRAEGTVLPSRHYDQEMPLHYTVNMGKRDGHDSMPSTISSVHSFKDKGEVLYKASPIQTNVRSGEDATDRLGVEDHESRPHDLEMDQNAKSSKIESGDQGRGSASRSGRARMRAPIALGSNMSISDMYGKAIDATRADEQDDYHKQDYYPPSQFGSINPNTIDNGSTDNLAVKPSGSDPKWVKANAVPVYKAKLIPNYENQSKYDPRLEGGIRGKAEAAVPSKHTSQPSNSSDVYRQELQKKSEHYVGGGAYPTHTQALQSSGSVRGSGILGTPTSYTVMPSKSNHYHASPIIVSQAFGGVKSTSENTVNSGDAIQSTDSAQRDSYSKTNFIMSPDGRLEFNTAALPPENITSQNQSINVPPLRSASAHNFLDREFEPMKQDRKSSSVQASPGSQKSRTQSRISRRDVGGKKITPTSHREGQRGESKAPQTVTSLIDRFEKNPDHLSVGLLDMNDKPPSMTSTPVARRKNQGPVAPTFTSSSHSMDPRPDGASGRSHSVGSRKSNRRDTSVHHSNQGKSKNLSPQDQFSNDRSNHSSKSPHQAVAPFYIQSKSHDHDGNQLVENQPQQHQSQGHQQSGQNYNDARQKPRHSNENPQWREKITVPVPGQSFSWQSPTNHQYHDKYPANDSRPQSQIRHSNSDRVQGQTPSDRILGYTSSERSQGHFPSDKSQGHTPIDRSQGHTPSDRSQGHTPSDRSQGHTPSDRSQGHTPSDRSQGHTPSDRSQGHTPSDRSQGHTPSDRGHGYTPNDRSQGQAPSDRGRSDYNRNSNGKRSNHSSQSQRLSRNSYATPVSSQTSHNAVIYQSPFLPKPEPHYPSLDGQQDPSLNQPQSHKLQNHYPNQQQQQQYAGSSSNLQSASSQSQHQQNHMSVIHKQPFQSRQSPQISYASPLSSQPPYYNTPIKNNLAASSGYSISNTDNGKYNDDQRMASKSSNSAFERPLKTGLSYNRQPGAMAVVKPTVLHL